MNKYLIVPVAADKDEYDNRLPYVFELSTDGIIICIKSILGIQPEKFDKIFFTILRKHDDQYFIGDSIYMQCKRLGLNHVKVVVLDSPTQDQAETIYQTICVEQLDGSVFVKDADSYFEIDEMQALGVAVYPIEALTLLDPRNKSYVSVDDHYYVTNIIEKRVVGHHISAGGYSFESCHDFCDYYLQLRLFGKLFLSHIIYAMLLDRKTFRPIEVNNYKDWGNRNLYNILSKS